MGYNNYALLHTEVNAGVATVVMDNPPINLLDVPLTRELNRLSEQLFADATVKVVVYKSADKEFFLGHADLELFQTHAGDNLLESLELFHDMVRRFRSWNKITIGQIDGGRVIGGGSEFVEAMDMRFAASGKAFFSHPEVTMGVIPHKGGTFSLTRSIGRGRTLEMILSGAFISAELAQSYGYINRALVPVALNAFVTGLARRIAALSSVTISNVKKLVDSAAAENFENYLEAENRLLLDGLSTQDTQERLTRFLRDVGQSREAELGIRHKVARS